MAYIVVSNYFKGADTCLCLQISEKTFEVERVLGNITLQQLGLFTVQRNLTPINFSVDRNNKVVQDCGNFSRFNSKGSAIVLAEIKQNNVTTGYKLLASGTTTVLNKTTEAIVERANMQEEPFLQNGIIRNNTVNCYKLHPYPVLRYAVNKHKTPTEKILKDKVEKPSKDLSYANHPVYTEEQKLEIRRCREHGLNSGFIENYKLSPTQMRVLWVSKTNGALSDAFADPAYSVDVMKFYADRLLSNEVLEKCRPMLNKKDLSVEQLSELFLCVINGVNYTDLVDKNATTIMVERKKREVDFWDTTSSLDIYDKAVSVAMKIKGY